MNHFFPRKELKSNPDAPRGTSGRPRKFREPSRPITVTLPESVLDRLAALSPDRARAIVKAVEAVAPPPQEPVELVEAMPGLGMILLGPSARLQSIKWLRLVELSPLRFLLVLPSGTSVDSLEVTLVDLLEGINSDDPERPMLERLRELIRGARKDGKLSKAELLFLELEEATSSV
jgi:hypothetical protein